MKSIQLKRKELENHYKKPFFDTIAVGFFVRILLEPNRYRACEIVRVKEGVKSYKFKNETGVTKVITLKYGSTEKDYQMCYVSNEPITQVSLFFNILFPYHSISE